ncbi:MAG TPA: YebC/PmpR family DNA-binding transcriptional regulator, partial [Candidatus Paceibacterota bacterium]
WDDTILNIYTDSANLASLKEKLGAKNLHITTSLDWVPKERVEATPKDRQAIDQLFESLDEQNDVQDIYSNL